MIPDEKEIAIMSLVSEAVDRRYEALDYAFTLYLLLSEILSVGILPPRLVSQIKATLEECDQFQPNWNTHDAKKTLADKKKE